jgi:hypothetical protein
MRKPSPKKPSIKQDYLENDFKLLPLVFREYIKSERKQLRTAGLSLDGVRIARAVAGLLGSVSLAKTAKSEPKNEFYVQQVLDEADALLFALLEGANHPAIEYFNNCRKKGRPRKDYFSVMRLEMATVCYFLLVKNGSKKRKARMDIEAAVQDLPGAVTAYEIEIYLRGLTGEKFASVKSAAEDLFEAAWDKARSDGVSIQPLELLVSIWDQIGPTRTKISS